MSSGGNVGNERVIELSIEETNKLRAELGLKPLNVSPTASSTIAPSSSSAAALLHTARSDNNNNNNNNSTETNGSQQEVLQLSIDETNQLRAKLGLKPLRTTSGSGAMAAGRTASTAIHKPPPSSKKKTVVEERLEKAKLAKQVRDGAVAAFGTKGLADDDDDDDNDGGLSGWAAKMMSKSSSDKGDSSKGQSASSKQRKSKKKDKKQSTRKTGSDTDNNNHDAENVSLHVAHDASEFEAGTTTILTLADQELLERNEGTGKVIGLKKDTEEEDSNALENVNMVDACKTADGLRRKRQVERAMATGGYANEGYDDDEFEELGGVSGVDGSNRSTLTNGGGGGGGGDNNNKDGRKRKKGFAIGGSNAALGVISSVEEDGEEQAGLLNQMMMKKKKAISLETSMATDSLASDFMTQEEYEASLLSMNSSKGKKEKKKKKKQKKNKRQRTDEIEQHDDKDTKTMKERRDAGAVAGRSLVDDLEATTSETLPSSRKRQHRRRRRKDDDDDSDEEGTTILQKRITGKGIDAAVPGDHDDGHDNLLRKKRSRFEQVMEKGNARSKAIFAKDGNDTSEAIRNSAREADADDGLDEEPDDDFLNHALAKARRLAKLRQMNNKAKPSSSISKGSNEDDISAAHVVLQTLQQQGKNSNDETMKESGDAIDNNNDDAGVTFAIDETREFTRALRAREEQAGRKAAAAAAAKKKKNEATSVSTASTKPKSIRNPASDKVEDDVQMEDVNMEDWKKLQENDSDDNKVNEDETYLEGTTGATVPMGRGMANVLSMLKQTGAIANNNEKDGRPTIREEMRGRAKDKRTYEDYEKLDLSKVVRIGKGATAKDRELASREITLDYRDENGRLLTRKEAYRNLCYQFHGYGSGKTNQERRLKQIQKEQAEGRLAAAASTHGVMGALTATQKATGKAFVVHKT